MKFQKDCFLVSKLCLSSYGPPSTATLDIRRTWTQPPAHCRSRLLPSFGPPRTQFQFGLLGLRCLEFLSKSIDDVLLGQLHWNERAVGGICLEDLGMGSHEAWSCILL